MAKFSFKVNKFKAAFWDGVDNNYEMHMTFDADVHLNPVHTVTCCRQTSNISGTLVGNEIVDHLDVLHLQSQLNTCLQWSGQRLRQDETRNI